MIKKSLRAYITLCNFMFHSLLLYYTGCLTFAYFLFFKISICPMPQTFPSFKTGTVSTAAPASAIITKSAPVPIVPDKNRGCSLLTLLRCNRSFSALPPAADRPHSLRYSRQRQHRYLQFPILSSVLCLLRFQTSPLRG